MERILAGTRTLIVECAPALLGAAGASPQDLVDRVRALGFTQIVVNDDRFGRREPWPAVITSESVNLVCRRTRDELSDAG